jgi:hypothetical protein
VNVPSKAALAVDPGYEDEPDLGVRIDLGAADWEAWVADMPQDRGRIGQLALVRPGARPEGDFGEAYGGDLDVVGVDSGQAGFFDPAHAWKDESAVPPFADLGVDLSKWYRMCCARTLGPGLGAGLVPHGVVSSSGWGDGGYEVFVRKDAAGGIETVRIVF